MNQHCRCQSHRKATHLQPKPCCSSRKSTARSLNLSCCPCSLCWLTCWLNSSRSLLCLCLSNLSSLKSNCWSRYLCQQKFPGSHCNTSRCRRFPVSRREPCKCNCHSPRRNRCSSSS